MAIVNLTPDSFYTSLENWNEEGLINHIQMLINQGADIIDIGACSTRPQSTPIEENEECLRLFPALKIIRNHFPNLIISIDTFRSKIAEEAIKLGADIINDISGGMIDENIWKVAATYQVPYILTYAQEIPTNSCDDKYDHTISKVIDFFQYKLNKLHIMGIKDVIIDPGFGFSKTELQNYTILQHLNLLSTLHTPIMVGISRKSMLYKPLNANPKNVLPATIAANTIALERGAKILRVHDVAAAKQTIDIYTLTNKTKEICY